MEWRDYMWFAFIAFVFFAVGAGFYLMLRATVEIVWGMF